MEGPSVVLLETRRLVTKILALSLSNFGVVEARLREPLVQPYIVEAFLGGANRAAHKVCIIII